MSANTKIEWCDHTFNPWIGCTKVSPGCANCYAEGESKRRGWAQWGKGQERHRTSAQYWKQPIKWNHESKWNSSQAIGRRSRVFCASLADWLDDEVPTEWLADLLTLITATPNLDWLLLTKRPENLRPRMEEIITMIPKCNVTLGEAYTRALADALLTTGGTITENVWIGVSAEDQERWDDRVEILATIPAAVRFVSAEPLLGYIDVGNAFDPAPDNSPYSPVDWVIIGGESGPKARMCRIEWIRNLKIQTQCSDVPVFVKQLGGAPVINGRIRFLGDRKGGDPTEWPEDLRVREFPTTNIERAGTTCQFN